MVLHIQANLMPRCANLGFAPCTIASPARTAINHAKLRVRISDKFRVSNSHSFGVRRCSTVVVIGATLNRSSINYIDTMLFDRMVTEFVRSFDRNMYILHMYMVYTCWCTACIYSMHTVDAHVRVPACGQWVQNVTCSRALFDSTAVRANMKGIWQTGMRGIYFVLGDTRCTRRRNNGAINCKRSQIMCTRVAYMQMQWCHCAVPRLADRRVYANTWFMWCSASAFPLHYRYGHALYNDYNYPSGGGPIRMRTNTHSASKTPNGQTSGTD